MKIAEILTVFLVYYGVDCYHLKLAQEKVRRTIYLKSSRKGIFLGDFDFVVPENPRDSAISEPNSRLKFLAIFPTVYFSRPSIAKALEQDEYIDNAAGYAIGIFPGWLNMPRKTPTKVTMSQYQSEEVLFVSSNYLSDIPNKEKNSTSLKIDGDKLVSNEFNRFGLLPGLKLPRNQMPS